MSGKKSGNHWSKFGALSSGRPDAKKPLSHGSQELRLFITKEKEREIAKKRALAHGGDIETSVAKKTKFNNDYDDSDSDDDLVNLSKRDTLYGDDMIETDAFGDHLIDLTPYLLESAQVRSREDDIADEIIQQRREDHYLRRKIVKLELTPQEKEIEKEKLVRTIFLSNVPTTAKDKDIKDFIGREIQVQSLRQRLAGFADRRVPRLVALSRKNFHEQRDTLSWFVVLVNVEDVSTVLEKNQQVLLGKHVRVDTADHEAKVDHTKSVFVGNLPLGVQEESLYEIFSTVGKIFNIRCLRDAKTGMGRGTAFVEFTDRVYVPAALKLDSRVYQSLADRPLRVTRVAAQAFDKTYAFQLQLSRQRNLNEKEKRLQRSLKAKGRSAKLRSLVLGPDEDEKKPKVKTQGIFQKTFGAAAAGSNFKKPRHNMANRTPQVAKPSWQGSNAKPSDKLGRNKAAVTTKNIKDKKMRRTFKK